MSWSVEFLEEAKKELIKYNNVIKNLTEDDIYYR